MTTLSVEKEEENLLTSLGLTKNQAAVYITLVKLGKAKAVEIASTIEMDRGNLYRIIERLKDLRLVEKIIGNPSLFRALPLCQGIEMLIKHRDNEQAELKIKARQVIENYQKNETLLLMTDLDCQVALVPAGKLTNLKFLEMFETGKISHDMVFFLSDYQNRTAIFKRWITLLQRGLKLRVLIFFKENEKLPRIIKNLMKKYSNMEVRATVCPPRSTITISDGNKAIVSLSPMLFPSRPENLWFKNPTMVYIIQAYFNNLWLEAKQL